MVGLEILYTIRACFIKGKIMTKHTEEFSHLLFSQREGLIPTPSPMNLEDLSSDIRKDISDYFSICFQKLENIFYDDVESYNHHLITVLGHFYKKPHIQVTKTHYENIASHSGVNQRLINNYHDIIIGEKSQRREKSFKYPYNRVLDFLEILLNKSIFFGEYPFRGEELQKIFNKNQAAYILYYFSSKRHYNFYPITSQANKAAVEKNLCTIEASGYEGAINYFTKACDAFRTEDYETVIYQSHAAVEAIAENMTGKATLGEAIKEIEKKHDINSRVITGIEKMTVIAHQVRHGKEPNSRKKPHITQDEALLLFGTYTSIASYFATKAKKKDTT